jgi:hypothetical protein
MRDIRRAEMRVTGFCYYGIRNACVDIRDRIGIFLLVIFPEICGLWGHV